MSRCAVVILAAGDSSRLGRPKQLLLYRGQTLLAHIAGEACRSAAEPVVVVLGAFAEECGATLAGLSVKIVRNPDWREGMASSIRAGIAAIREEAEAAVILLCDQPQVSAALIDALITVEKPIVAATYAGTVGAPVFFARGYFDELLALTGDHGAKKLLQKHAADIATTEFPAGEIDIDTADDLPALDSPPRSS